MATTKKDLFDDNASQSSSSSSSDDSSTSSSSSSLSKTGLPQKKSDDGDGDDMLRLSINKKFARSYQNKKEKEELTQIRQRKQRDGITESDGSSDSDSSDEEEDEDGALFTPSVNVQFLKTIKALRKKDASIYDPTSQFFDDHVEKDNVAGETKEKPKKPQRYKDVVREQILHQIKDEENGVVEKSGNSMNPKSGSKLGYDEEQDKLRKAFMTESSHADGDENEDDLLVVKKKSASQGKDELEQEASKELKEIESLSKKATKEDTFKDPRGEIGDGEQFLLDFITKKKWVDRDNFDLDTDDDDDDANSSLDDVERADEFESNYNFRYEKAAEETATSGANLSVQTYARSQTMNTVRRQDTTRKDKRQARKERKLAERKEKEERLKRLKNAKKKEINNKLSQVKAVIGGLDESAIDEAAIMKMLEGDYDPEKFEKAMEQAYGEEFYEQEDKEWKTDLDVRKTLKGDEEGDELVGVDDVNGGMYDNVREVDESNDKIEGDYDEAEEWNDEVYEDSHNESALEGKLKKKMEDELYKLDYEDIIAGMPTRFKYREVESNDYGLTTQEILFARDTTLKQFVSLKKMAPYNDQGEYNVGSKKRRKFREMLKNDLENSLPVEDDDNENAEETVPEDTEPKKKRRRLKKGKKKESESNAETESVEMKNKPIVEVESQGTKKRRRKKSGKKIEPSSNVGPGSTGSVKTKAENPEVKSSKSNGDKTMRSENSGTDKRKKKKKNKEKKSSIRGISHARLASYKL